MALAQAYQALASTFFWSSMLPLASKARRYMFVMLLPLQQHESCGPLTLLCTTPSSCCTEHPPATIPRRLPAVCGQAVVCWGTKTPGRIEDSVNSLAACQPPARFGDASSVCNSLEHGGGCRLLCIVFATCFRWPCVTSLDTSMQFSRAQCTWRQVIACITEPCDSQLHSWDLLTARRGKAPCLTASSSQSDKTFHAPTRTQTNSELSTALSPDTSANRDKQSKPQTRGQLRAANRTGPIRPSCRRAWCGSC